MIIGPKYGTPAWNDFRRGKVTASRFGDVMTEPRSKAAQEAGVMSQTAENYLFELVASTVTGQDKVGGKSAAMDRGVDMEADAIDAYSRQRFVEVGEGRILQLNDSIICATPDGFVDDDDEGPGIIECKCPESKTHLATFLRRQLPEEYVEQVQGQLWVSGRRWCDFMSYDDRFPLPMRLVVIRVRRDEEFIERMERKVHAFAGLVRERLDQVEQYLRIADPDAAEALKRTLLAELTQPEPERLDE